MTNSGNITHATQPAAPKKKVHVLLDDRDHRAFRHKLVDEGKTAQDVLEDLVRSYIARRS